MGRILPIAVLLLFAGCDSTSMRPTVYRHKDRPYAKNVVEYFLPIKDMPEDVKQKLHPWLRELVGKEPSEVKGVLVERWNGIQNPALKAMRDRLLEFEPDSILITQEEAFLSLRLVPGIATQVGETWYLPPPENVDWEMRLNDAGIDGNAVTQEFLKNFAGLRESTVCSGNFLCTSYWETFPLEGYKLSDIKGAENWSGSLIVYTNRGGHSVLLHPTGRMAWWLFAENEIHHEYKDFAEFTVYFTEFNRKYSAPFDPFPNENYLRLKE